MGKFKCVYLLLLGDSLELNACTFKVTSLLRICEVLCMCKIFSNLWIETRSSQSVLKESVLSIHWKD